MLSILKSSAASVLALAVTAGAAAAVTQSITFDDMDPTDNFQVSQFNPGLGTLLSIEYTGTVDASNFSGLALLGIALGANGDLDTVFGPTPLSVMISQTISDPAFFAPFVGMGMVEAAVSAPVDPDTVLTGDFEITYTYDDGITPAPIPLPAGAPLLIAGLGGLALLRKKQKG